MKNKTLKENKKMTKNTTITFKVTPSEQETIQSRAIENGFDDVASYIKVVALKTQTFNITSLPESSEEASIEIQFSLMPSQETKMQGNIKESGAKDMGTYLTYVALHSVVSSVVEVRSSGNFEDMLARIAKAKKR